MPRIKTSITCSSPPPNEAPLLGMRAALGAGVGQFRVRMQTASQHPQGQRATTDAARLCTSTEMEGPAFQLPYVKKAVNTQPNYNEYY